MVTHGMMVGGLMRAKTQTKREKKESECAWCEKRRKGDSDRVKEEILLKVMNVSLSFLLYDPGAFANYPDFQRSGPFLLPTREMLGSSAKYWPCYSIHQGQCL